MMPNEGSFAAAGDGGIGNGNGNGNGDAEGGGDGGGNGRDSSYQRYDIQHAARWVEQVLPFSLLLLVVFIRQHLQGAFFNSSAFFNFYCIIINEIETI